MAYTKVGSITNFTPDDTDTEMYLISIGHDLQTILDRAKEKWPESTLGELEIEAEHIHTNCITYDLHDPSDYTDYLKVTYTKDTSVPSSPE